MFNYRQEWPALLGSLGLGFLTYHLVKHLKSYFDHAKKHDLVPIGVVQSLYIFPLKSGKGHKVFSFFCDSRGPKIGELKDREFQLVDGLTGNFYSARQKPQIVLIETDVRNNHLHVKIPGHVEVVIDLGKVGNKNIRRLNVDTLDCGEEVSKTLSLFLEESDVRMVMYDENLFNERVVQSHPHWWNNNRVPERRDKVTFHDFAPYLIHTESSLKDLNSRLVDPIEQEQMRPVIVVDKCPAYDEDKWSELQIGDVKLQMYLPCYRCILTTIDPKCGQKHIDSEPLKMMRSYRLTSGNMRQQFKESPIFGVCAGLLDNKSGGYIHEGQTVYARYKPSAF